MIMTVKNLLMHFENRPEVIIRSETEELYRNEVIVTPERKVFLRGIPEQKSKDLLRRSIDDWF